MRIFFPLLSHPCLRNAGMVFLCLILFCACSIPHKSHVLSNQYWSQAEDLKKQKKYFEAAGLYKKSAMAEQNSPEPRLAILSLTFNSAGYHYSLAGQHSNAIECFQQALTIDKYLNNEKGAAAQLQNIGKEHYSLNKYDKAMKFYQQSLELNRRVGEKRILAVNLNEIAVIHELWGQYDKALNFYQQALDVNTTSGNQGASLTQLNNIGNLFQSQGAYEKALTYFNQAMEINKTVRNVDIEANLLNNIGHVYKSKGEYGKAIEVFQKSLRLCEKFKISNGIAFVLNNIGTVYSDWGRYDDAIVNYQRSLSINQKMKNDLGVATNLNNMGKVYGDRGLYDIAINHFEQALAINDKLQIETARAVNLHNIGELYLSWGKYDTAIKYFTQALEINKKVGKKEEESIHLNKIGQVYLSLGKYDKAMEFYQKALSISQKIGYDAGVETAFNNIGVVYFSRYQYDDAIAYFKKGIRISERTGHKASHAVSVHNIGIIYGYQRQYEQAINYFMQALAINRKLGREPDVASVLSSLGRAYGSWKKFDRAIEYFKESIRLLEKIRKTATGDIKRDYLASQINTYQLLASAYLQTNNSKGVLEAVEQSRARVLLERIAGINNEYTLPTLEEIQKTLAADEAIVLFSNISYNDFILMVITDNDIAMKEVSKGNFLAKSQHLYSEPVLMLLEKQRGQLIEQEPEGKLSHADKTQQNDFGTAIRYYRKLLITPNMQKEAGEFARLLHQLLIEPAQENLTGKTKITIVPDGILGFLPFETLKTSENSYLTEDFTIKYTQSLTIYKLLQQRDYSKKKRKPMLAMGGAIYEKMASSAGTINTQKQLVSLQKETSTIIGAKRSTRSAYARLGVARWANLPGTLEEVEKLSAIIPNSEILIGDNVTEHKIKQYSKEGKLSEYQALHFATHGLVMSQIPELSALVLSQYKEGQQGEDGYLRMGEIAKLDIAADFVNLSACETGLGKIYGGEGVVGLTQSFLIAGANGLAVSLWQVSDASTAAFMVELYKNVYNRGMGYDQALMEVKGKFINGDFGEQWRSPYFWSPFVYYGK